MSAPPEDDCDICGQPARLVAEAHWSELVLRLNAMRLAPKSDASSGTALRQKAHGSVHRDPAVPAHGRLRDRISLLSLIWEGKEWQAEYRAIGDLAEDAVMRVEEGGWIGHARHSTRTRRDMPVEGFRGTVTYDRVHPDLLPLLRIGQEIHVGQHVVWGNGRYRILDA